MRVTDVSPRKIKIGSVQLIMAVLLIVTLLGCGLGKIKDEDVHLTVLTLHEDKISYYVIIIHAEKSMMIKNVHFDKKFDGIKAQALEYSDLQTPEGWESQKRLRFPLHLEKNDKVTIMFTSDNPDLLENKKVFIEVNDGQIIERDYE
ncbi:MAG TPA: hypothetical protein VIG80_01445 [Bacillaceae bacterium]